MHRYDIWGPMNEQTFVTGHVRPVTSCDTNSHRNVKKKQPYSHIWLRFNLFFFFKTSISWKSTFIDQWKVLTGSRFCLQRKWLRRILNLLISRLFPCGWCYHNNFGGMIKKNQPKTMLTFKQVCQIVLIIRISSRLFFSSLGLGL